MTKIQLHDKKVIMSGRALIITLPKFWLDLRNIEKGDAIKVAISGENLILSKEEDDGSNGNSS